MFSPASSSDASRTSRTPKELASRLRRLKAFEHGSSSHSSTCRCDGRTPAGKNHRGVAVRKLFFGRDEMRPFSQTISGFKEKTGLQIPGPLHPHPGVGFFRRLCSDRCGGGIANRFEETSSSARVGVPRTSGFTHWTDQHTLANGAHPWHRPCTQGKFHTCLLRERSPRSFG